MGGRSGEGTYDQRPMHTSIVNTAAANRLLPHPTERQRRDRASGGRARSRYRPRSNCASFHGLRQWVNAAPPAPDLTAPCCGVRRKVKPNFVRCRRDGGRFGFFVVFKADRQKKKTSAFDFEKGF